MATPHQPWRVIKQHVGTACRYSGTARILTRKPLACAVVLLLACASLHISGCWHSCRTKSTRDLPALDWRCQHTNLISLRFAEGSGFCPSEGVLYLAPVPNPRPDRDGDLLCIQRILSQTSRYVFQKHRGGPRFTLLIDAPDEVVRQVVEELRQLDVVAELAPVSPPPPIELGQAHECWEGPRPLPSREKMEEYEAKYPCDYFAPPPRPPRPPRRPPSPRPPLPPRDSTPHTSQN